MTLRDILFKIAGDKDNENDGWLGVKASPEIKARMKIIHRYIKPDDLAEDGLDTDPHITMAYGLGKGLPEDVVQKLMTLPKGLRVKISGMSMFDNPDSSVLKFDIDSEDMHRIHKQIKDEIGLPGSTYSDYKPHMTVAYLKPGTKLDNYKALERLAKDKEFIVKEVDYSPAGQPQV